MHRTCLLPVTLTAVFVCTVASARAVPLSDRIDAIFAPYTEPGSPGAAVAVIRDGKIVHAKGYGLANLELEVPITPASVFYLCSVSKQFTAASIVLLEQQGKLSLEDDIRKYFPEIPDYGTPITIRHLVHHTSGLRDYLALMSVAALPFGAFHDDRLVIDLIARQKGLNFPPGERYSYSNSGYFLMGAIVKKVSGLSLREFAEQQIFGPLGMEHTHYHDDFEHLIPNRASGYFAGPEGLRAYLTTFDRVGSGGVYSSVEDLALWDRNFSTGQVGGEAFLARMHERGRLNDGRVLDYAFGLVIGEYRGLRVVEHGGALGGFRTATLRIPDERFSVIVLSNVATAQPQQLARQIVDLALADRIEAVDEEGPGEDRPAAVVEVPAAALRRVEGTYWNGEDAYTRRIYVNDDGVLTYWRSAESETPLAALGEDLFQMVGLPAEVAFGNFVSDRPRTMVVTVGGQDPVTLIAYEPSDPTPDDLAGFVGRYHGEELPVDYEVLLRDGTLLVRGPDYAETPMKPGPKDVFVVSGGSISFTRGADGGVDGFVTNSDRARGLLFERLRAGGGRRPGPRHQRGLESPRAH